MKLIDSWLGSQELRGVLELMAWAGHGHGMAPREYGVSLAFLAHQSIRTMTWVESRTTIVLLRGSHYTRSTMFQMVLDFQGVLDRSRSMNGALGPAN